MSDLGLDSYSTKPKVESMKPLYVVMELSARCYAGCPGCFRSFVKGDFDNDMSQETFLNAIRDIPRGTMILPQFHGESLYHKDFPWHLERFAAHHLRVSMPASGATGRQYLPLLTAEDSPCYILIMSIDGECEHSQTIRRGNITLDRVTSFTREAIALRGNRKTPWIAVRWVEGGQSELEFEAYLKHWLFNEGVDFVLRSRLFTYGSEYNSPSSLGKSKCHSLIEGNPVVLWNGDVMLCERLADREKYLLGNVNTHSWQDMMARRDAVARWGEADSPCRLCSAAYLLTGFRGIMELRHPDNEKQEMPIYVHSDHSQTFYSLSKEWSGISWSLE